MASQQNEDASSRAPKLKRACKPCADSKSRCDSSRPCQRCARKGIEHLCVNVETKQEKEGRERLKSREEPPRIEDQPSLVDWVLNIREWSESSDLTRQETKDSGLTHLEEDGESTCFSLTRRVSHQESAAMGGYAYPNPQANTQHCTYRDDVFISSPKCQRKQ
eukprot:gb/GECG01003750.1/.p1 GENE.gb/GECG01003750.1/~~gb/GECG01003750.1/.p1  ORF type:complete len:163 (+),score=14.83 gb/GECG01003750.1/:1-489(+)